VLDGHEGGQVRHHPAGELAHQRHAAPGHQARGRRRPVARRGDAGVRQGRRQHRQQRRLPPLDPRPVEGEGRVLGLPEVRLRHRRRRAPVGQEGDRDPLPAGAAAPRLPEHDPPADRELPAEQSLGPAPAEGADDLLLLARLRRGEHDPDPGDAEAAAQRDDGRGLAEIRRRQGARGEQEVRLSARRGTPPMESRPLLRRAWQHRAQYLAISPFYLWFLAFGLYPLLYSLSLSLHSWSGFGPWTFVGLRNYAGLLGDDVFWRSLANSLYFF